jgi:dephospho-CoA kinase
MTEPLRLGLTGGIGTGKSTVCKLFRELGVPVIDADQIAKDIVAPGQPAFGQILEEFGDEVTDDTGRLKRDQLRSIVFRDPTKRKRLEAITHPRIIEEMRKRAGTIKAPYCILCIPLLVETGLTGLVAQTLVVDTPEALQKQRVMQRDRWLSAEQVEAVLQTQASRERRLAAADRVITNDADIEHLRDQVLDLHRHYLQICERGR